MKKITDKELNLLKKSVVFDAEWYASYYKDVGMSQLDAYTHFLKYGYKLLRDPNPNFSSLFYYETMPIVKKKKLNPVLHFLTRKQGFEPDKNSVVWAMYLLSLKNQDEKAIGLGEKYLKKNDLIYPFKANQALKDGSYEYWLKYLNLYLKSFDLLPISGRNVDKETVFDTFEANVEKEVISDKMISVIMPAWNAEDSIEMAATSILNQTWKNIELIIVDDASEDSTWEKINNLAKNDKRVKLLRNSKNYGPYVSKNRAARISVGSFITGHDSDDWAHPERLETQANYLIENSEYACLSGMLRVDKNGKLVNFNKLGTNTEDGITRSAFISLMVNNHFFRNFLGYWDNVRFGADSELIRRIEAFQGKPIKHIYKPTMLCLDNPYGLTNHPIYGHSPNKGVSQIRLDYKNSFLNWHKKLKKTSSYLNFYELERPFSAPNEALNEIEEMKALNHEEVNGSRSFNINCDVCIITNLCFPGGNGSSTLEEIRYLNERGFNVKVVHSPRDTNLNKKISERYFPFLDQIVLWNDVQKINAKHVIVRHPGTIVSKSFSFIKNDITCDKFYFVINNSMYRTDGDLVYSLSDLISVVNEVKASEKLLCPISYVIRNEIRVALKEFTSEVHLSTVDWNPTFNLPDYDLEPKKVMSLPFAIGRHGRDGSEKWIEDKWLLNKVYPSSEREFSIEILGGATNAEKIIGTLPTNWRVKPFGAISPKEYLSELDVFVYFPNTNLSEAFGRTIVEAMFAGIPCVLPHKFKDVFGELAFYGEPHEVSNIVYRLSQKDQERVQYLIEVKDIALELYSSNAISKRLDLDVKSEQQKHINHIISQRSLYFKRWVEYG